MLNKISQSRFNPFYHPITFSTTTEDHRVVERALRLRGGESLLCIASSGDTPLNLLTLGVDRIDAVDMSLPQLFLAQLKSEGLRGLDLPDFHRLVGIVRDRERALSCYDRIRAGLAPDARAFWDRHRYMIARGVLWEGGLIRFFSALQLPLRLALGADGLEALARLDGPDEARAFGERYLDRPRFRALFRMAVNRLTFSVFYPRRGFAHLPPGMSPGEFSMGKVREILRGPGIARNPYLFPMIFRQYPTNCVPPYLSAAAQSIIRERLDRVRWVHSEVLTHLRASPASSMDAFALCNVVDWMPSRDVIALFAEVARVGRAGARVLAFSRSASLLDDWPMPPELVPDRSLGAALLQMDRTAYHRSVAVFTVRSS